MQGAVYHWTISTGFSLAEASNLYLGSAQQLVGHLCRWSQLLHAACTQVGSPPQHKHARACCASPEGLLSNETACWLTAADELPALQCLW